MRDFAPLSRREFCQLTAAGITGLSLSGWLDILALRAAQGQLKHKACILLWMDGGPSHKDTFDLKPGTRYAGEFKPISTSVPGIQISEHFPKLAKLMQHVAILRGMNTGVSDHNRARYYMHTGYREGQGGVIHPSLGSIVSHELGRPEFPLPNFVAISARVLGAGYLGPRHEPLVVLDPNRGVENLRASVADDRFNDRISLLEELEQGFYRTYRTPAAQAHHTMYARAVELMRSKEAKAFDLSQEPASVRQRYGGTRFGDGCLLARRLIEVGVKFVEVGLGGWDTHQNNFPRVRELSAQVDSALSALIEDLHQRGLLDSTLIIWMGEFGRTPHINNRGPQPGRDHWSRAWSTLLIGGGIKGGQVIGKTDAEGATVVERPISALDFLATVCTILGIDYTKQYTTPRGRPIRIVDRGANPIKELL
ncbi:MAG: DUF1501 domain-containing protein [Gemmatales bacterium]|nr:DUF1501 domain-containing protein [Gemmatales bacterium]MDW7995936.1 DUF1501 domain-containing protein [Gemmatales bacterium]